jgi:phosphoribosylanthranilate isomerase
MAPLIKICGMKWPDNIAEVAKLEPDFMGFIFYEGSKRFVGKHFSLDGNALPASIKKVGVFVNASKEEVEQTMCLHVLDYAQLHGHEEPEYCQALHAKGIKLIKAFAMEATFNFSMLEKYVPFCSYFLFDTATPAHGGSGQTFDWDLLSSYTYSVPVFLSGGISLANLPEALTLCQGRGFALDVNSRFETEPGLKHLPTLSAFEKEVRQTTMSSAK